MPIISRESYTKTEKIVQNFLAPNGIGQKLQSVLVEKYQKEDNWVKI
jgi:hypothetical protein